MVIKKKSDKNWEYCVYLGQDNNGKKKYKRKCGFRTKKECIEEAKKYENKPNISNRKKLSEVFEMYIEDRIDAGLRITTINTNKSKIKSIKNNFDVFDSYIDTIKAEDINNFIKSKYFCSLKHSYKQSILSLLRSVFIFATKKNMITVNIFEDTIKIRGSHNHRTIWSWDELNLYLPKLKSFKYYDLVILALETGMRRGEIVGLTWDCVNLHSRTVFVNKTAVRSLGYFGLNPPKTNSSRREILLFDNCYNILKDKYKNRKSKFVFYNPNNPDKPVCPVDVSLSFAKFIKENKMKHLCFHDLRHIHATFLLKNNVNYKMLSRRLGHSNVAFTLQTYTHVMDSEEKKVFGGLKMF